MEEIKKEDEERRRNQNKLIRKMGVQKSGLPPPDEDRDTFFFSGDVAGKLY